MVQEKEELSKKWDEEVCFWRRGNTLTVRYDGSSRTKCFQRCPIRSANASQPLPFPESTAFHPELRRAKLHNISNHKHHVSAKPIGAVPYPLPCLFPALSSALCFLA